jgi:hypothetical protein
VLKRVESHQALQKGSILDARGFGIDNKTLTCACYNVFDPKLNLKTYNETLRLLNQEFKGLFSD